MITGDIATPVTFEVSDPDAGLTGWVAIDSLIENHCHGGLRILSDVTARELELLARAMTLKFAFFGLPHGGGKAGLQCDEEAPRAEKLRLLTAFGRGIKDLLDQRIFFPGHDMGSTDQDIREMLERIGVPLSKRALAPGRTSSGWYTGLTVIASAQVAAAHLGLTLSGCRVAIEGFGDVGGSVAKGISRRGGRVVGISTKKGALYAPEGLDVDRLLELSARLGSDVVNAFKGAERIDKEELLALDLDLLIPCARHHSITMDNVSRVNARAISSGANLPLTDDAEEYLFQRGVLIVPDFISNAGGVIGGTMEFAGIDRTTVGRFIDGGFKCQVSAVLSRAVTKGVLPRKPAEQIAHDRFDRLKAAADSPSMGRKVFSLLLKLYRNGLIPKVLVGRLARGYFAKRIAGRF